MRVSYVALTENLVANFVDNWSSVTDIDADFFRRGWQVVVVMSMFVGMFAVFATVMHKRDARDKQVVPTAESKLTKIEAITDDG